jgi:amino acid transporter
VLAFTVVAAAQARHVPWVPFVAEREGLLAGFGLGLASMMWNYSGWDTPTTCLAETKAPTTAFRRAAWLALPLIVIVYVLPVGAALSATGDWASGSGVLADRRPGGRRSVARRLVMLGGLVAQPVCSCLCS